MHQLGVRLPASDGKITNSHPVDHEGGLRFLLGNIHLIVGGGVEHDCRIALGDATLYLRCVGDVDVRPFEAGDSIPALGELGLQLYAELSATSEYRDPISLHFFIMNQWQIEKCDASGSEA
jgi:hypothetical protein